jgi:DNA-binding beta-propeller fold protein YncE
MKTRSIPVFFLLAFCVAASCSAGRRSASSIADANVSDANATPSEQGTGGGLLRRVGSIPLPRVQGRIDHMAIDVKGRRLFVAALGNNTIEVIDLKKGERVVSVNGFDEPQGLVYISEPNRVVVANGGDGGVTFLDGESLKPLKTVRTGGDADNVRYDSARGRVYASFGEGSLFVYEQQDADHYRLAGKVPTEAGARTHVALLSRVGTTIRGSSQPRQPRGRNYHVPVRFLAPAQSSSPQPPRSGARVKGKTHEESFKA